MNSTTWIPVGHLARQALQEAELRTEYPELAGLSTGVGVIDERLRPALEPGRLVVIAGESGRGKTALAAQLAAAFAHQVPVLWCSLEDDQRDATKRAIANIARVPISGLRSGFHSGAVPKSAYDAAATLEGLPLWLWSTPGDVVDLAWTVARWRKECGGDGPLGGVVIIDQLSHIIPTQVTDEVSDRLAKHRFPQPPGRGAADHQRYEWQVNLLREVAVKLGVLVVLLHQLNQVRTDDGRPTAESIRGSQGIVHKADACLIPWRPKRIPNPDAFASKTDPKTVPAPEDAAELICVKGRAVADGWSVPLRWDGAHQRFADPAEVDAAPYVAPPAPTGRALEGARKFAELRARFAAQTNALTVGAHAELQEGGDVLD